MSHIENVIYSQVFAVIVEMYHFSEQREYSLLWIDMDFAKGDVLLSSNNDIREGDIELFYWAFIWMQNLTALIKHPYSYYGTCVLCAQSCRSLGILMNCSLPGSSVHGMFQVRILEKGAIFHARGSFQPRIKPASLGFLLSISLSCIKALKQMYWKWFLHLQQSDPRALMKLKDVDSNRAMRDARNRMPAPW